MVQKLILLFLFLNTTIIKCKDVDYMLDPRLASLGQWPTEKPQVAEDHHGWFINQTQLSRIIKKHKDDIKVVVELGSWLGVSTRFFLDQIPDAVVVAVDHWKGCAVMQEVVANRIPTSYETFLVNCWQYKNRLIPCKTSTIEGIRKMHDLGIKVDLIYLDASHDYDSVMLDLMAILDCYPNAIICGDDFDWSYKDMILPVQRAVFDFSAKSGYRISHSGAFWRIKKIS